MNSQNLKEYYKGVFMENVNILYYFTIYGILGWCLEVAYAAVNTGTFVNRGFLNGPICPIYGIGAVLIIDFLTPFKNNLILLFVTSIFITSLLEYMTGFILEKIFNNKWWDYSKYPFNIKGYICLKFSLAWGIACVLVMRIIHPLVENFIEFIPQFIGAFFLLCTAVLFVIDIIATIDTVLKLNFRLKRIHEISDKIKQKSDTIGKNISDDTIELKRKYEYQSAEFRKKYDDFSEDVIEIKEKYKKEIRELKETYKKLTARRNPFHRRLIKAFPNIKSNKYFEALNELKRNAAKK
ncbi:putative ABC transporter permease [Clostridium tyrobutyricum]|uniref:putative ABC transporter permease n=2 Tax=Clostridium tyrobutyricum TaxID=1519 RepID=UPI0020CB1332|nr:hypothetical protein [Clostridium tyrobutyricum]